MYDFSKLKNRGEGIKDWFKKEISSLRTGQASPLMVEDILVDSYGSKTPLKHVAAITLEDARTIRVSPWDKFLIKEIEQAIFNSPVGVSPIADNDGVRVVLPELTKESRQTIAKILGEKLEDSRISVRQERDEVWKDIQKKEKDNEISEDDKFLYKDKMQESVDTIIKDLEDIAEQKRAEIVR